LLHMIRSGAPSILQGADEGSSAPTNTKDSYAMIPLLFIILVTGLSVFVSWYYSSEVTWFTYYVGGIAGLLVSGIALEIWNRKRRAKEEEEAKAKEKKRAAW